MAVNPIVNRYGTASEKQLLDDLTSEAIATAGVDVLYIPRVEENMDHMTEEDPLVRFEDAVEIEMYVNSFESFQGDGHFMDKLGVHIVDQISLKVSTSRFGEVFRPKGFRRPREGDLVWFPLVKRLFEIKFVDKWPDFYPINHLPSIDLRCEFFEYSGQRFATGIPDIDGVMQNRHGADADADLPAVTELIDPLDDSSQIQAEANNILDFSEQDPYSEGHY
jgi:hypothetical protein